jgi:protein-S-isoprenylcysteine O-methyltransferase Ste14
MTGKSVSLWIGIGFISIAVFFGLSYVAFSVGRDDWVAFFLSPARVGMIVVSLILTVASAFSGFGGMNPGKKEDRRNRWIFIPFAVLSLALAVLPAYFDGRIQGPSLWTTDEIVTPYFGLALLTAGGVLRIVPMFVLGRRFTGIVAIQDGHRLETGGLYRFIRHPSYAGMLLYMAGYVLVFRCWLGLLLVAGLWAVLVARMNAEEALLEGEFGDEYASYKRRTWRLVPWVY